MSYLRLSLVVLFTCTCPAAGGDLVFALRTWTGEYFSKDIPGGVETSPVTSAIYTIGTDGTGLKKVVGLGKDTTYPVFSPDGKWLYFQSNASGSYHLYRCKPDGTGITNLTTTDRLAKPLKKAHGFDVKDAYGYALSADGSKMVFTVQDSQRGQVVLANADDSSPRLVAPQLGYIYMAALSPKADRVVFSGPARGYRLLMVKLPAGKPEDLTPDHPQSFVPRFTPDGNTIVFFRRDGDVYRVDADGKNLRRLTKGNRHVEFRLSANDRHGSSDPPDISPDGKQIAYVAVKEGVANVCVMNPDGSGERQLTFRKTACGRVKWSPDSKEIAFVSFEGKYPQLFVVAAKGGTPRQLTKLPGAVYFIHWKP
jgi:Tol biopolymer transport system component